MKITDSQTEALRIRSADLAEAVRLSKAGGRKLHPKIVAARETEPPSHDFDYDDVTDDEPIMGHFATMFAVGVGVLIVVFTLGVICGSVFG